MSSPLVNRARECYKIMNDEGDLGVRKCIILLAEDNTMIRQELKDLYKVTENCVELLATLGQVVDGHNNAMETIRKKFYPNNEANPDQSWEDR